MNFRLQPTFLKVLTQIGNCDETKEIFSYSEILNMFSRYVVERSHTLVDLRNPKVLLLENDPLKDVFKVKAFHRCQVKYEISLFKHSFYI